LKEEEKTRGWQWADIAAVFYMNFWGGERDRNWIEPDVVYLFQTNEWMVPQGQSGPWAKERVPGFLSSSNSRIPQSPVTRCWPGVACTFLSFFSRVGPRRSCHMQVDYMVWRQCPVRAGLCTRCSSIQPSSTLYGGQFSFVEEETELRDYGSMS
jgi:hypothetical protein